MNTTRLIPVLPLIVMLFAAGCERSSPADAAATPSRPPAASSAKAAPADGRSVEITCDNAMKFSVTEIHAKPGEAISVTLKNLGTMPKFSMGHNWVLLAADVDIDAFAGETGMAAKTDYIPPSFQAGIIAHTKLLGPKESDTVTFNAPKTPGRYVYLCSFPGHYQVGMKGVLIVE